MLGVHSPPFRGLAACRQWHNDSGSSRRYGGGSISRTETLPDKVKEHPAALSEHDELLMLRDAIQASNNVVILTEPNPPYNPIISVNNGFEKLTDYRRDEALGRNCRFLQGDNREQEGCSSSAQPSRRAGTCK